MAISAERSFEMECFASTYMAEAAVAATMAAVAVEYDTLASSLGHLVHWYLSPGHAEKGLL
jgi:hypothetical protein